MRILLLVGILVSIVIFLIGLFGCKPARWCDGDPRLTPAASGTPVVLERVEIKIGGETNNR